MQYGKKPDLHEWIGRLCPDFARDSIRFFFEEESELKIFHLYIFWDAREVVEFSEKIDAPLRFGVLWWIGTNNISFSADLAATLYFQKFGRMPLQVWMKDLPKGHDHVDVQDVSMGDNAYGHPRKLARMAIQPGSWIPGEKFLVVGIEKTKFAPVWTEKGFVEAL